MVGVGEKKKKRKASRKEQESKNWKVALKEILIYISFVTYWGGFIFPLWDEGDDGVVYCVKLI